VSRNSLSTVQVFRRYVTEFVNRHDFSVLPSIMVDDYQLETGGLVITGRDGPYQSAVAKQLEQFPGLVFTPHELFHIGDRLAVRFTEHGTSIRHDGRAAAWMNIAIYSVAGDRLSHCAIEQDYFSRREQLSSGHASLVDRPHIAPWDVAASTHCPAAESAVRDWLGSIAFVDSGIVVVDGEATGIPRIIAGSEIEVLDILASEEQVAFHAVHRGELAGDFESDLSIADGAEDYIHLSGLVRLQGREVCGGHIIRDRWGLYRRLANRKKQNEMEA